MFIGPREFRISDLRFRILKSAIDNRAEGELGEGNPQSAIINNLCSLYHFSSIVFILLISKQTLNNPCIWIQEYNSSWQ